METWVISNMIHDIICALNLDDAEIKDNDLMRSKLEFHLPNVNDRALEVLHNAILARCEELCNQ